jgi:hypothetical protein
MGLLVRVGQRLDCRPQPIDQRAAVTNLRLLLDTGERVPQCQQSLAAEPGGVQLLPRSNGNLVLVDGCRRLAAQRDSVIANNVNAHEWVLLNQPAPLSR